jgi:hypothetical protein
MRRERVDVPLSKKHFLFSLSIESYNITNSSRGPLANSSISSLEKFFMGIIQVKLSFSLKNLNIGFLGPVIYNWDVDVSFDFPFIRTSFETSLLSNRLFGFR